MVLENTHGIRDINLKENFLKIKDKAKEFKHGMMVKDMKETGKTVDIMDRVYTLGLQEINMLVDS